MNFNIFANRKIWIIIGRVCAKTKSITAPPNTCLASPKSKGFALLPNPCTFTPLSRCDNFYNLPTYLGGSRASGIGKGNKMNLVNNNKVPAPGYYHINSDLKVNRGVKFPLGREVIFPSCRI